MTSALDRINGTELPPHDSESEYALLCHELREPGTLKQLSVHSDMFYVYQHSRIAVGIERCHADGVPVDVATLESRLPEDAFEVDSHPRIWLRECHDYLPSLRFGNFHAGNVLDCYRRREAAERARNLQKELSDPRKAFDEIIDRFDCSDLIQVNERENPLRLMTASEFNSMDFQSDRIIEGVANGGQFGVIGALYKGFKTSLASDMAISKATGLRFLNHFETFEAAPVGMFLGEGHEGARDTMRRIVQAKSDGELCLDEVTNLHISTSVPRLESIQDVANARREIEHNGLKLAVFDPFYRMAGSAADKAGNVYIMGELLWALVDLARETGCAVFVCHHFNRSNARTTEPPDLSDLTQSGMAEAVGQWILLRSRTRFDVESATHEQWLVTGGRTIDPGLYTLDITEGFHRNGKVWQPEVRHVGGARRETISVDQAARDTERAEKLAQQQTADRKRIYDALAKVPNGETKSKIRDLSGIESKRFDPAFAKIIGAGGVEECQVKKDNGQKYPGFRLTKESLG